MDENTASQSGHLTSTAPSVYPSSSRNGGKVRSTSAKLSIPAASSNVSASQVNTSQCLPSSPNKRKAIPLRDRRPASDNNTSEARRIRVHPWTLLELPSDEPLNWVSFSNSRCVSVCMAFLFALSINQSINMIWGKLHLPSGKPCRVNTVVYFHYDHERKKGQTPSAQEFECREDQQTKQQMKRQK